MKETRDRTRFFGEYKNMLKLLAIYTLIFTALLFIGKSANADYMKTVAQSKTPIVVELFTSQSCSSCPPADIILSQLAKHNNVIALGCHVSYWNHLHWKDTLSHDFCDVRQHGIQGLRGQKRIYTPQMVVNGKYVFVGSNAAKLTFAMKRAAQANMQTIIAQKTNENTAQITLPQMPEGKYHLWGFGYKNKVTTNIGRGENSGRIIDYAVPVTTYSNLGPWNGSANSLSFEIPDGEIDGIAVFAQKDAYGEIVAAGKLEF